jgi:hypothetical protein
VEGVLTVFINKRILYENFEGDGSRNGAAGYAQFPLFSVLYKAAFEIYDQFKRYHFFSRYPAATVKVNSNAARM